MSNGVNQCAACGGLWDDDEPHVACRSDPCPDPSICDRHNCAAAAAYCDGVADERERAAERVAAALAGQHKAEQYDYPREGQTTLYCRSCADLCHSETGLMCEFPHDGAWPCEGYEDGLKLVAAARGGDA